MPSYDKNQYKMINISEGNLTLHQFLYAPIYIVTEIKL